MATTTIRLPPELKARVAAAAERAGTTPHGFILDAIEQKARHAEQQTAFHQVADERRTRLLASGDTIAWTDMRCYLEERLTGQPATTPKARKLAR